MEAMTKKAQITNVTENNGKYTVTYESGVKRTYSKMTKTIKAWMDSHNTYSNPFFKDLASETIFYLLQMSGEERTDRLHITVMLYKDKSLARRWRDDLMKIVHPDNCKHPMAAQAAAEVTRIYKRMAAVAA